MSIFSYFRGVKIHHRTVLLPYTGTKIALDRAFFKSAAAVIKLNSYVLVSRFARFATGRGRGKTIAFYPQPAGPWYNAWIAAHMAGLKIISDPYQADYIFIFDDATYSSAGERLSAELSNKAINHRISDISKRHVSEVFKDIFGYSVDIDPLTHHGPAVRKSNANGTHDGEIITCPIDPLTIRDDCVYQKLIDSTFNGTTCEDLRIAYVLGDIPVVSHKHIKISKRFGTDYARVDVKTASDVFSKGELDLLIRFCKKMGLDFGAVDVLRDKHDGRLYVVDVNKTCMPVLSLSLREQVKSFRRIAQTLSKALGAAPPI